MTRKNTILFIGELINIISLPLELAADVDHIKQLLALIIIRLFKIIARHPPADYLASLLAIIKNNFYQKEHIILFVSFFINLKGVGFIIYMYI